MTTRTQVASRPARPRLGFLGVGWIGRHRMEAIAKSGVAEVAGIVDPSPDAAKAAQATAQGSSVCGSFDELVASGIDGLVIATPSAHHAEQAIAALDKGLAVFCQKPLGRHALETARVVEAAKASNRLLGVDFSYRFTQAMQLLRPIIAGGELGDVYAANLVFHNAYGPDKQWFYDPKLSGGGCVVDLGIHLVDLALWALDFPVVADVTSQLFSGGKRIPSASETVEDYAAAQLELSNGCVVQLACSWRLPAGCDCVIEASFYGTKGGASFRNVNGSFYDFVLERFDGTRRQQLCAPPDVWGGRAAVDWAQRLAAGEQYDASIARTIDVARTLDRIRESGVG